MPLEIVAGMVMRVEVPLARTKAAIPNTILSHLYFELGALVSAR